MSSSSRLCQLIASAHKNNDLPSAIDAYNEWQMSNCYHPRKLLIYDAHYQTNRFVFVPCGSCYHCLESKTNEWVTRMYAHAEDFKYVYFITLTYRSYDLLHEPERLMMDYLGQSIFHRDSFNERKHECYSPCLLIKKHYQNFIKRLRKYAGLTDLSYVLSGEYGKKYGRPHFHAVLFSNTAISRSDINRAWSVALWHSNDGHWSFKTNQKHNGRACYFSIGRVDYNDLVSNGSFNTSVKVKVEGQYLNAGRCFAYVCKYLQKQTQDTANFSRVSLAYNSLYSKETFIKLYNNEMSFSFARKYLQDIGYPYEETSNNLLYNSKLLKQLSYEKIIDFDSPSLYGSYQRIFHKTLFGHDCEIEFFPRLLVDFRTAFSSFVEFSRGTPIGSIYAKNHLSEFKDGVFNKPILQDSSFVVPAYFRNKARESDFGLRRMRETFKGTSFYLGGLYDFRRLFETFNGSSFDLPFAVPRSKTSLDYNTLLRIPTYTLRDLGTKERMLVIGDTVKHFKYNRSNKTYEISRQMPVAAWIRHWCCRFLSEYAFHDEKMSSSIENLRLRDRSECLLTDLGANLSTLRESFVTKQNDYLHRKQVDYNRYHLSAE